MPMSLWCRSIRNPGSKVRLSMFGFFWSSTLDPASPPPSTAQGRFGIDPVGLQEYEGLGEYLDVGSDDQLIGGLDRLAGAIGSDVDDRLADRVEDRFGHSEVFGRASHHDRKRRILRSGLTAGDRRVEQPEPFLGRDIC